MPERSDDTPLTSEEMIEQARSVFSEPIPSPDLEINVDEIDEEVAAELSSRRRVQQQPARPRRQAERRPPTGFGTPRPQRQTAVSLAISVALLILGAAVFLAIATSSAGG